MSSKNRLELLPRSFRKAYITDQWLANNTPAKPEIGAFGQQIARIFAKDDVIPDVGSDAGSEEATELAAD